MSSKRHFSAAVKREAFTRAKERCEARGDMYGLPPNQVCGMPLDRGHDFDHVLPWEISRDSSLENCACVCRKCHKRKTFEEDIPRITKTRHQRDKRMGIRPESSWPSRRLPTREDRKRALARMAAREEARR